MDNPKTEKTEKTLKIIIVGEANTGKTTTAHIIRAALEEQGFERVSLKDTDPSSDSKPPIDKRIETLKKRKVVIEVAYSLPTLPTKG